MRFQDYAALAGFKASANRINDAAKAATGLNACGSRRDFEITLFSLEYSALSDNAFAPNVKHYGATLGRQTVFKSRKTVKMQDLKGRPDAAEIPKVASSRLSLPTWNYAALHSKQRPPGRGK
ncbi:hypothetical protein TNIN_175781 [Trichonephila inaurata madagascariensis]|uniref:Uncharacterized protein n=1 Tax=Trichonephila inaurata madagascariensis TaxID=2747483 RepID=A0A8X6X830_9ARAC|nr:hypothetical protein TNIN_175781 [Trichonephila inaurata madagascariensis]